jgi:tellurite resistance protein
MSFSNAHAPDAHASHSRLAHMPISMFGMVMGLAGFTIAMDKGEALLQWSHLASTVFTYVTYGLFGILALAYFAKLLKYPGEVRAEFNHVVRLSFFPAISISMLLISIIALTFTKP